jgi:hypothetical protein
LQVLQKASSEEKELFEKDQGMLSTDISLKRPNNSTGFSFTQKEALSLVSVQ